MKLPRRVPWTSISELDQVCSWIFADDSDSVSKTLAINRVSSVHSYHPIELDHSTAISMESHYRPSTRAGVNISPSYCHAPGLLSGPVVVFFLLVPSS
jgi:hypothetical protein